VVVARGRTAARLQEGGSIRMCGETSHTLPEVMTAYWALANGLVPFFATVTNAPIDDLEIELAFDGTEGVIMNARPLAQRRHHDR
jgi:hypothetical protein